MTSRIIPFFNYPVLYERQKKDLLPLIDEILSGGRYIMQKELENFESDLARYLDVKYALGVADGTMALILALKASNIGLGDEVLVPSHTFVASAAAIAHVGATPVLVECDWTHLMDPGDLERRITSKTKAIMPVQLNGRVAEMNKIIDIAKRNGLIIIEDAAQALGAKFKGEFAGTFGVAGTFSFYPSKTLGGFGDGGAVVTNDSRVADSVRLLRDHGRHPSGEVMQWGFNSRLDNLQAGILGYKLKHYSKEIERRREIAALYHGSLDGLEALKLPPPPSDGDHFDIFQNYEIEADYRDELRAYLDVQGVKTIIQWGGKVIHQYPSLGLNKDLPMTELMSRRYMLLPMNTSLSNEDISYICEQILTFYRR